MDTIKLYPAYCKVPTISPLQEAVVAAKDLTTAIQKLSTTPAPQTSPSYIKDLTKFAKIFDTTLATNAPSHPAPFPRVVNKHRDNNAERPQKLQTTPVPRVIPTNVTTNRPPTHRYPTRWKQQSTLQHTCNAVFDEETGKLLEYKQLMKHPKYAKVWARSYANELGRLAQGIRDIKGTDTIFFITKQQVPSHKKVSYGRLVCDVRLHKAEQERTRLTVGGDQLEYFGPVTTETADITTVKVIINSVISTQGAKFATFDIKNFYLGTPMKIF